MLLQLHPVVLFEFRSRLPLVAREAALERWVRCVSTGLEEIVVPHPAQGME